MHTRSVSVFNLILVIFITILSACGGSGGGSSPASTATLHGTVFAAPVSGAAVVVKNASGSVVAGPVNTAPDGTYSINVPASSLSSDLRLESTSGTYVDEATGATTTAHTLAAYVSVGTLTASSPVNLDPSTTIVDDLVTRSSKTFGEANAVFSRAFGFAPDSSITSRNTSSMTATAAERLAGLRAMAFSQMTRDMGLSPEHQFDLIDAIAEDLADGSLDSMNSTTVVSIGTATVMPADIENRFERALVSLLSNTACNQTGITEDQIGSLPFAKVALTDTYRVEYIPGMMAATVGRTAFKIKITRRDNGSPVTGQSLSLMPVMHMPGHEHATPVDKAIVDNGDGTYSCTIYYLMASGMGMGYWELDVLIGGMMGEDVAFFPSVGMSMGTDTVRSTLKGQNDIISSMTGTEKRSYYLFRDSLASGATTTFGLYIAAKESMMSYPGLSLGTVLSSPTGTVTTMTVQASTDNSTWVTAADSGNGHWTLAGLTGLSTGVTGTVYVKLNVNGEDKTTDGNAASGTNASAIFLVTPH